MAFPKTYVLCGDNHEKAVERTRLNIEVLPKRHKMDLLRWSVGKLPFKDSNIDVFVTDMVRKDAVVVICKTFTLIDKYKE